MNNFFKLLPPKGQIIDVKCKSRNKSVSLNFVSAIIKKLNRIHAKFKLSRPQGQIIAVISQ